MRAEENAYPLLNFVDPVTGEAVGWEYEAVNEICRRLNCAVAWSTVSWLRDPGGRTQSDVGMDGITITAERATQVAFSAPYLVSQQYMLVRADETFHGCGDVLPDEGLLIDQVAGGTTNFYVAVYEVLTDEQKPGIKSFEIAWARRQALLAGDVDLVLMDAASSRTSPTRTGSSSSVSRSARRSSTSSSPPVPRWWNPSVASDARDGLSSRTT